MTVSVVMRLYGGRGFVPAHVEKQNGFKQPLKGAPGDDVLLAELLTEVFETRHT